MNEVQKVIRWLIFSRAERLAIKKYLYNYREEKEIKEVYEQIVKTFELDHK